MKDINDLMKPYIDACNELYESLAPVRSELESIKQNYGEDSIAYSFAEFALVFELSRTIAKSYVNVVQEHKLVEDEE